MTIEEIKRRKKELRWTNAELAERSGIPVSTVAKILGGSTLNPRQHSVHAMEEAIQKASFGLYPAGGKKRTSDPSGPDPDNAAGSAPPACHYGNSVSDKPVFCLREADYVYGSSAVHNASPDDLNSADHPHIVQKHITSRQPGGYTIDDYLALPDDRRVELIDGRFYDMAAPTGIHQIILFQIWKALDSCIEKHGASCTVQGAPFDVQLFNDPYTVVQPDIMVFCTHPEEAAADRARSAPDFIAEILSPSTAFRDRTQKLCRYRDAGVKEVWIVSPMEQTILVYRFFNGSETPESYTFHDSIPLGISDHRCAVDFSEILKRLPR